MPLVNTPTQLRRALILVAQQFLDSPDDIAICSPLKIYSGNLESSQIRTLPAIAVERSSVPGYSMVPWLGQSEIYMWPKSGMWKGVHSIPSFSSFPPSSCSSSGGIHGTPLSETVLSVGGAPFPNNAVAPTHTPPA